jgi:hypothetical protein
MQVEDDFEHGRSRTLYFLRERRSNERLELKLSPEQAAGASCAIKVTFKPTTTGSKVATLTSGLHRSDDLLKRVVGRVDSILVGFRDDLQLLRYQLDREFLGQVVRSHKKGTA